MVDTDDTTNGESDREPNDGSSRRLVSGWVGRYYEDFVVGDIYKHPYGRTVTETDNVWFTNVSMNLNPMHFNEAYAAQTEFGERLVDGTYVIALAVGMSVSDVSQNDDLVLSLERTPMVLKREFAEPSAARPPGWIDGVGTQPEELD